MDVGDWETAMVTVGAEGGGTGEQTKIESDIIVDAFYS